MSGIAGILHYDESPIADTALNSMLRTIGHRGPNSSAMWLCGRIGVGCNSTLPESSTNAPILVDRGLVLAADVRLDNRGELASTLGLPEKSTTDSALIQAAYRRWGEECPQHLLGDFAFALWDCRRERLFCARDHFGVKPFYYYSDSRRFAFASEMKALFALVDVPRRIDEARIADYLVALMDDAGSTVYTSVRRLPARHLLTVSRVGPQLRPYWQLEPGVAPGGDPAEQLRAIFAEAVRCRLRSAAPVGAMLSGGLDSSSIACAAAPVLLKAKQAPLKTFSLVFDKTPAWGERPFIEAVLAKGGFDPFFIDCDDYDPFSNFDRLLFEQDGLFHAPGLAVSRRLYHAAAEQGVVVLLDGHGGDEVISQGYGRLHELARAHRWFALWREMSGVSAIYGNSRWSLFSSYLTFYGFGKSLRRVRRLATRTFSRGRSAERRKWCRFVNPDLVKRTDLPERYRAAQAADKEVRGSEQLRHAQLLGAPAVSQAFGVLDHTAVAAGIEPRYPFWDKRLVEFCLSLPSDEKLRDGWSRSILRRAMEGVLPPAVQWRRDKVNFGPAIAHGMLTRHRDLLQEIIYENRGSVGVYIDLGEVAAAYERIAKKPEVADGLDIQMVWQTTMLALWLGQRDEAIKEEIAAA